MRKNSRPLKAKLLALAASLTLLGAASACGSGSTVDNSQQDDASTVPSVGASPSDKGKGDKGEKNSEDKQRKESGDTSRLSGPHDEDGSVEEVDEVPERAERSKEEKDYLGALEDKGVDFAKAPDATRDALQSQILTAGYQHCGDPKTTLIGVAAGQLLAQGIVEAPEGDAAATEKFQDTMKTLRAAADEHLCA